MPTWSGFKGVTAAEILPHFNSDYCLRCCDPFHDGQGCHVVWPTPTSSVKYRDIGLELCDNCVLPCDRPIFLSVYISSGLPLPLEDPNRMRPRFTSNRPLSGFLRLNLLDNGFWRVGLHRAYPEVWTKNERIKSRYQPGLGYSRNYELFGPLEILGEGAHAILESGFIDLAKPWRVGMKSSDPGQYQVQA